MSVRLPDPVVRARTDLADLDLRALEKDLRRRVDGEVRFDPGSRGAYSTDASNYRQVPLGVVVPRTVEAAVEAVAVCREHGAPVLSRGGATSLAGQCTNVAVVLDWSKYCHRIVEYDPDRRSVTVEPGIVLDTLNERTRQDGLVYGPEPATHYNCTLGGMIGNNSCGATAQRVGKVVDNVRRLEVLLYDGTRAWVGPTSDEEYERIQAEGGRPAEVYRQLRELRDRYGEQVRERYPQIPRRVSGYNLDALLPEQGFDLAKLLVGSEGTLVTVLRAELPLVEDPPHRAVVMIGYDDVADAGDGVPKLLEHDPIGLEGLDHKLIEFQQRKHLNPDALNLLPPGRAFLLAQFGGEDREAAVTKARHCRDELNSERHGNGAVLFDDEQHQAMIWKVRESGLGATARVPALPDTWPGWEDSAVAPEQLGPYLRDLQALYDEFGYGKASVYGHFGQGCVHSRIPFELKTAGGIEAFRRFMERAADLCVCYGGSFSGEHGDGQARAELLTKMFGEDLVRAFGELKAVFDPGNRMNPGKVAAPHRLDEDLRYGADWAPPSLETAFGYPHDDGSFSRAVSRCVGVGKCRRSEGGVMCPSYMVTQEEEHSTRGRSRLLFEMLNGHRDGPIRDGWRSKEVLESLDLCLACKGCKSDCPVNVDMATYKVEFLHQHYKGRLRPRSAYAMGWLPLVARVVSPLSPVVNTVTSAPVTGRIVKALGGVDRRRDVPVFARQTLRGWWRRRAPQSGGDRGEVVLWPDTFTDRFHPHVGRAAVEVLEAAGWRVRIPEQWLCCGLTWISTGQLDVARRVLNRTVDALREHVRAGGLVVALEPSCLAVLRSDAAEFFPDDLDVERLRRQAVTLAELLHDHTPGWQPPQVERRALVQTHCHQHAVLGRDADAAVMEAAGLDVEELDSGCCGLAGNFGFEDGHYDVSMACAERVLLPRLREAPDEHVILADGFSCRTQIEQGRVGRTGLHLAEVLAGALRDEEQPSARVEDAWAERPRGPRPLLVGAAGLLTIAGAAAALAASRRLPLRVAGQRSPRGR
jgi:FAD/FMN-containing dehydrogenase/Fe-S oxidoreductase